MNISKDRQPVYSLQEHSLMFNLSLCAFLMDLKQSLDPCCLQFSEETFKNSLSHFRADFTQYVVPESSYRQRDSEVWVSQSSHPQLFSLLQLLC